MLKKTVH